MSTNEAIRHDAGKIRYDLLPVDGLAELALLYTLGGREYGDRNWEMGMNWSRVIGALERHTQALKGGEDIDPTTGLHHGAAIAWNGLALLCYHRRGVGVDDRVKVWDGVLRMVSDMVAVQKARAERQQTLTTARASVPEPVDAPARPAPTVGYGVTPRPAGDPLRDAMQRTDEALSVEDRLKAAVEHAVKEG